MLSTRFNLHRPTLEKCPFFSQLVNGRCEPPGVALTPCMGKQSGEAATTSQPAAPYPGLHGGPRLGEEHQQVGAEAAHMLQRPGLRSQLEEIGIKT